MSKKKKSKKPVIFEPQSLEECLEKHNRIEPLRKDLERYLCFHEKENALVIHHPFCNQQIYDLERCALIHEIIDERTPDADACFEDHDYEGYIYRIADGLRPQWLAKDAHLMPDDRYWTILGWVYWDLQFTHYNFDLFHQLFRADRPGRENLMEPDERDVLARLPDELTVYRGYAYEDDDEQDFAEGIAWTLDRHRAVWFANRHCKPEIAHRLITGKVWKKDVWGYFRWGDLLLPPEKVFDAKNRQAYDKKAWCCGKDYAKSKKTFNVEDYFKKS